MKSPKQKSLGQIVIEADEEWDNKFVGYGFASPIPQKKAEFIARAVSRAAQKRRAK
jgi:hypothetical protein